MAWLKDIPKPKCYDCGKPAKYELMNNRNACLGVFCAPHARSRLRALAATEHGGQIEPMAPAS